MSDLTNSDMMEVVKKIREKQYMMGYKDGYQQGQIIGFDEGIERGLKEIRRVKNG